MGWWSGMVALPYVLDNYACTWTKLYKIHVHCMAHMQSVPPQDFGCSVDD